MRILSTRTLAARALAGALLLGLGGCGDDGPGGPSGPGNSAGPGTMTARVDGQSWTAASISRGREGTQLVISGTDAQGVTINLQVSNPVAGTIAVEPGSLTNLNVAQRTQGWVASGAHVTRVMVWGIMGLRKCVL